MALRIASLTRINGPACKHLRIVVEEGPMGGPAVRDLTISLDENALGDKDAVSALSKLVKGLPDKGELKGAYLFSRILYERLVKGTPMSSLLGVWVD
jgi:hypothetical protein